MHYIPSVSSGRRQAAYTVVELLSTIAVAATLTSVAAPGLRNMLESNRATGQANSLTSSLYLARSEAVTRSTPVSVCASDDGATCTADSDWGVGWIVFTDNIAPLGTVDAGDLVLQSFPAASGSVQLTGSDTFLTFTANGFLQGAAVMSFEIRIPGCTGENQRDVSVNLQGRASVSPVACSG